MQLLEERSGFLPHRVLSGALRKRVQSAPEARTLRRNPTVSAYRAQSHQTDLARLYRNAMVLVLPSRLEGWGLPAGEAL